MRVNRSYGKKHTPPVLLIVLGVVLVAGLSFGGAYLWQRLEQAGKQANGSALFYYPFYEERGQEVVTHLQNPPHNAPPDRESPLPTQPDDEDPATDVEASPLQFAPGPFSVAWQVSPSDPVDISYFDNAIFFGDSVSAGIIAYQVVNNASSLVAIGACPQTALDGLYITTPHGPMTLLEAALEKGEKSTVYIMLGSSGLHLETDDFISGYQAFISAVRAQYPSAVIYIKSMTPAAAHVGEHHPGVSNQRIIELNAAIAEMARRNNLPFLNIFEAFADEDGYLPANASRDGLHLSAESHFIWLDYLKAHTIGG